MAAITAGFLAVACSSDDAPPEGFVGHVEGNFGGAVAGEPRAALIGRDVLSAGGNAADAVVAMYFALAVTYPEAATLGGEGACVVQRSNREGGVEAIEFRPLLIRRGGKTIAVPGNVRAMAALHARYGRLQWERLIQPAERLARFGNQISRAFAQPLGAAPDDAFEEDAAKKALFYRNGKRLGEGDRLNQVQLASVFAGIRFRGAGDFYTGDIARRVAEGLSRNAGVTISVSDIRNYRPVWLETAKTAVGNHELNLPGGPKAAAALEYWRRIADGGTAGGLAEISPGEGESIGFAAIDLGSGAAACTVGAHGAIRNGRVIGDTGILQAGPRPARLQYPGLPMLLVNVPRKDILAAVTAAGEGATEARTLGIASRAFKGETPFPGVLTGAPPLPGARTNMIYCPTGFDIDPDLCKYAVDPGGYGLAVSAGL